MGICQCVCLFTQKQENDLFEMNQLLRDCYKYYLNGSLRSDCENVKCLVPAKCVQSNAAYQILHFLTDNKFNVSISQLLSPLFSLKLNGLWFFFHFNFLLGNKSAGFNDDFFANGKNYQNTAILL